MEKELTIYEIEKMEIENKISDEFMNDSYLNNSTILETYYNTVR